MSGTSSHWSDWGHHSFFGGLRRRILGSMASVVGWVSFVLLYFAFWAGSFTLFQSIVLMVVSVLVLFGLLAGMWISFGLRFASGWDD